MTMVVLRISNTRVLDIYVLSGSDRPDFMVAFMFLIYEIV